MPALRAKKKLLSERCFFSEGWVLLGCGSFLASSLQVSNKFRLRNGRRLLHGLGCSPGSPNSRASHEYGTSLHGEGLSLDVAAYFSEGADLYPVRSRDVSVDFSLNNDRAASDLGLDFGLFSDGQGALRNNSALDPPVDDEISLKSDFPLNFDVTAKDIALARGYCDHGARIGLGMRLCVGVW